MLEYWDAYLENGQRIEKTLIRGQAIPTGLYHLVVEVIVQHADGSLLFMKRHPDKESYPNYFEITAGGSALRGESAIQAIHRELLEETGINAQTFTLIETYTAPEDACLFNCFYTNTDIDKASIQLQDDETSAYLWVPLNQINSFIDTAKIVPHQLRRLKRWLSHRTN